MDFTSGQSTACHHFPHQASICKYSQPDHVRPLEPPRLIAAIAEAFKELPKGQANKIPPVMRIPV